MKDEYGQYCRSNVACSEEEEDKITSAIEISPEKLVQSARLKIKLAEKQRLETLVAELERENGQLQDAIDGLKHKALEKVSLVEHQFSCLQKVKAEAFYDASRHTH